MKHKYEGRDPVNLGIVTQGKINSEQKSKELL
jgi:hypothetical protein